MTRVLCTADKPTPFRSRLRRTSAGALCVLSVLFTCGAGCAAQEGVTLLDEWQAISMGGARIGYVHSVTRRLEHPEPEIVTSVFSESRVKRLGIEIRIRTGVEFHEAPDGAVRAVTSRTHASLFESVSEAVVQGDQVLITTRTAGSTHTKEMPWDTEVLGPHAQTRKMRDTGLKAGATVPFKVFLPEFQRVTSSTVTVKGRETVEVGGEALELWRATMVQDILPGIPTEVWMDDDGNIVRSLTELLGGVETLRVTREKALEAVVPEELADVMISFFIKSNVEIENPQGVKEALYRIEAAPEDISGLALEDRRQTIEERSADGLLLRVRALDDASDLSAEMPGPEFLASSPYVQSDDPEIVGLARKAVGKATAPRDKAKRLSQWVYENVKKKDLSVGFASAKEVLLSRQGDCSEHAVLLAAMLRAQKIPSRVVVGVVYWRGLFGYHMWTEGFLNDWTAFDPTLGGDVVDATHIKFAAASLDAPSPADPFLLLVRAIGKIKLSVEEVKE